MKFIREYYDYLEHLDEIFASELEDIAEPKRMGRSKEIIVKYDHIKHRDSKSRTKTIFFLARDPNGSGKTWEVKLQIPDYKSIAHLKKNISTKEKVEMAMEAGNVWFECGCPDWVYGGFAYIGTQLDYSLTKEDRPPVKNNPNEEGSVCKHCLATIERMSNFYPKIADDIEKYQSDRQKREKK